MTGIFRVVVAWEPFHRLIEFLKAGVLRHRAQLLAFGARFLADRFSLWRFLPRHAAILAQRPALGY